MLKKDASGVSMAYDDNGNDHISDSALWLNMSPQLPNMTQCHHIVCGCENASRLEDTNSCLIIGVSTNWEDK